MDSNDNQATTPVKPVQRASRGLRMIAANLMRGFETSLPDGSVLWVDGSSMTKQAALAALQQLLDHYTAIDADRAQLTADLAALRKELPGGLQLVKGLKAALLSRLGSRSPQLAEFDIAAPRPRRKLTAAERTLQVAKMRATRQLRHTLGKIQRAAIRSNGPMTVTIGADGAMVAANAGGTSPKP